MANWVRRSPQNVDGCPDQNNPACANAGDPRTVLVVTSSAAELVGPTAQTVAATQSSANAVALVTTAWTSLFTNDDGSSYTRISTEVFTEAAPTTKVLTTPTGTTARPTFTDPPEAQSASQGSNNSGVSKGAVAGIAIGTCIVGAVIAFIAAWLLFKRRDKKFIQKTCPSGYPVYADSSPELVMVQKSAASGSPYVQVSQTQMRTPIPVPARVPAVSPQAATDALSGILPPAATEHDIGTRVSALFAEAKRHIDKYYRDVHASITPSMDSDLAAFGKNVDILDLLQNCSHPTVALKHALVAFVLTVTGPRQEGGEQSLWPSELATFIESRDSDPAQLSTAQALHRRLTVHIYTQQNSLVPTNRSQSRLSNLSALSLTRKTSSAIREAAEHFSLTFFPWTNPTFGDQERENDLIGIVTEALETRIWLAGQVGEWDLEWEVPGRGAVVVSPSLVFREHGRAPRRVVLEQSVVGI